MKSVEIKNMQIGLIRKASPNNLMTTILIYFRLPILTRMSFSEPLMNMPNAESHVMNMAINTSDVLEDKWRTGKTLMTVVS